MAKDLGGQGKIRIALSGVAVRPKEQIDVGSQGVQTPRQGMGIGGDSGAAFLQ